MKVRSWPDRSKRRDDSKLLAVKAGQLGALMDILETQLKHVGYELDMLVYTFDKLLLVEPLVRRSFQAGQVNALTEHSCT